MHCKTALCNPLCYNYDTNIGVAQKVKRIIDSFSHKIFSLTFPTFRQLSHNSLTAVKFPELRGRVATK